MAKLLYLMKEKGRGVRQTETRQTGRQTGGPEQDTAPRTCFQCLPPSSYLASYSSLEPIRERAVSTGDYGDISHSACFILCGKAKQQHCPGDVPAHNTPSVCRASRAGPLHLCTRYPWVFIVPRFQIWKLRLRRGTAVHKHHTVRRCQSWGRDLCLNQGTEDTHWGHQVTRVTGVTRVAGVTSSRSLVCLTWLSQALV